MAFYSSLQNKTPQPTDLQNQDTDLMDIIFPLAIFIRLGISTAAKVNGKDMDMYEKFCAVHKSAWFSSDLVEKGMDKRKKKDFLKAIHNARTVRIFFATDIESGGQNEIVYEAVVIDIQTDKTGMLSPNKALTPVDLLKKKNKIWLHIKELKPCTDCTVQDFMIASTENKLANALVNSQFHFGYIKKISPSVKGIE